MNIISVDLPWKKDKEGHRILAIADLDGSVTLEQANDDNELLELVRESAEPESIILLDLPIEGYEELSKKGKHFRPVDTALLNAENGI